MLIEAGSNEPPPTAKSKARGVLFRALDTLGWRLNVGQSIYFGQYPGEAQLVDRNERVIGEVVLSGDRWCWSLRLRRQGEGSSVIRASGDDPDRSRCLDELISVAVLLGGVRRAGWLVEYPEDPEEGVSVTRPGCGELGIDFDSHLSAIPAGDGTGGWMIHRPGGEWESCADRSTAVFEMAVQAAVMSGLADAGEWGRIDESPVVVDREQLDRARAELERFG